MTYEVQTFVKRGVFIDLGVFHCVYGKGRITDITERSVFVDFDDVGARAFGRSTFIEDLKTSNRADRVDKIRKGENVRHLAFRLEYCEARRLVTHETKSLGIKRKHTHCFNCRSTITSERNEKCGGCGALICHDCHSCFCGHW